MSNEKPKVFGAVVVRLADRMMLSKVMGVSCEGFTIPSTAWADLVSRCGAPHFRTSAFLQVASDASPSQEVQLSYHIMTDEALGYAVLCTKSMSRREGHAVLDDLSVLFNKMFVENAAKLNPKTVEVFTQPARDLLIKTSAGASDGTQDKVRQVKQAVDEAKNLALDNVDKAIQRSKRIDDIVHASDDLQFQAQGFQRSSRELSDQIWWNSVRGKLIIGGTAVVFLLMVSLFF
ncbi:vesicle-associated membrane protein 7 [Strigomonas culicis]|uniref:Vesicle-associated membrane protein 7 n=1 Tax=Strigomonas culicis TaxID=28005 RepID=S9W5Q3_9TRYP|nr:vesicle-associated membrane protein 7 [Strigomonas culicis]|eukprot:EPY31190.1 vesicle-associated membrane protein 7 [Strigomonas culicis]